MARLIPFIERRGGYLVAVFAALILLVGVPYAISLGEVVRFLPDEQDYITLAGNLVALGQYSLDGVTPTAYRAPGYPFLLAGVRWLGGGVVAMRLVSMALLALIPVLVAAILRRTAGRLAMVLGAALVLAYPVLLYTAGTLYPQTLAGALLLGVIYLVVPPPLAASLETAPAPAGRQPSTGRLLLAGVLLGWLVLTVPASAFSVPLFALWVAYAARREKLLAAVWLLVPVVLLVGAWTFRNWQVFDTFIFVSSNSGENLLVGNSENTTPLGGRNIDISAYERGAAGLGEIERDRFYRQAALEYIQGHPAASLRMYLLKVLNYFHYRNDLVSEVGGLSLKNLAMLVTYGALLVLALARLLLAGRDRLAPHDLLWIVIYLGSALATAVFFPRIRFRLPFDLLLILLDGAFLAWLVGRLSRPAGQAAPILEEGY